MLDILRFLTKKILFFVPSTLISAVFFEAASLCGRLKARPLVLDGKRKNYVNLGSGPNVVPGLLNIDFFNTRGIDYGADLRYPLKIASSAVDGIFCEHTLEHLTYSQVDAVLGESCRILKPGGVIRLVLPDLSLFMRNYCAGNREWFARWEELMFTTSKDSERAGRKLLTSLEAVSFVTQEYGHVSCWDFETLAAYLKKNGFREITKTAFREGRCAELLIDLDDDERKFVSLYVEAVK